MAPPLVSTSATTALLALASAVVTLASLLIRRFRRLPRPLPARPATRLVEALAAALPGSVLLPGDEAAFTRATTAYWAAQEGEAGPDCVLRPRDALELGRAVAILRQEHARQRQEGTTRGVGLFAVRSGGHSAVPGAASVKDGVLIDLSLMCEVTPSDDGTSVTFGAGAKWKNIYQLLDEMGLAVVGGRNSDVGVGGLTLGGKFFSILLTTLL
jgi:hypothetical protein